MLYTAKTYCAKRCWDLPQLPKGFSHISQKETISWTWYESNVQSPTPMRRRRVSSQTPDSHNPIAAANDLLGLSYDVDALPFSHMPSTDS